MHDSAATQHRLLNELLGTVCQCGKTKFRKQSFCRACYYSLSRRQRKALYRPIGQGYEQSHAAAMAQLSKG